MWWHCKSPQRKCAGQWRHWVFELKGTRSLERAGDRQAQLSPRKRIKGLDHLWKRSMMVISRRVREHMRAKAYTPRVKRKVLAGWQPELKGLQALGPACAPVAWCPSAKHGSLRRPGELIHVCQLLQSVWGEEEIVPLFVSFWSCFHAACLRDLKCFKH